MSRRLDLDRRIIRIAGRILPNTRPRSESEVGRERAASCAGLRLAAGASSDDEPEVLDGPATGATAGPVQPQMWV
eukprot:scaffold11478_cov103-Isochrysis_galbana.AAC.5